MWRSRPAVAARSQAAWSIAERRSGFVADQRHQVESKPDVDRGQVLVEVLPVPRNDGRERAGPDVLDAAERREHRVAMLGPQRRQRQAAVAPSAPWSRTCQMDDVQSLSQNGWAS